MNFSILIALLFLSRLPLHADLAANIARGDQFDQKQQPTEALRFYKEAEKEAPDDPVLLVSIARQYSYQMNLLKTQAEKIAAGRQALAYSERAVEVAPNQCAPHLSVAISLGKLAPLIGNRERVEASRRIKQSSETAVRLDPKNDYAWHILGRWHQALANMGAGTRVLVKVVYGGIPAASNEEAVKHFQKAIALKPRRLIHTIELGRTYAQMGRTADARKWIQKGLAMPNKEFDDPETKKRGKATLAEIS
jgi:tetratricopeptide (TPR) repeat protein